MPISAEQRTTFADQFAYDSSENIVMFKIEDATDEKILNRFTNSILNHPRDFAMLHGGTYTGIAIWEDSVGEVQLSSDCTDIEVSE